MDIDAILDGCEAEPFSGSILAARQGQILCERWAGNADRATGRPIGPRTTFQIASISKQFTAAAVLLLQEQQRLDVRDPICRWVPNCPEEWQGITVHALLTHTSGIVHWDGVPDLSLYVPTTRDALIRIFQREPLEFEPGLAWAYSSPAYVLAAHIVEQVSGTTYASFLHDCIFAPLALQDTAAGNQAPCPPEQATGYSGAEQARVFDLETVGIGAGDVWSTPRDLVAWDRALMGRQVLSDECVRAMFARYVQVSHTPPGLTLPYYGYGWCISTMHGQEVFMHTGENDGFVGVSAIFPDLDAQAVVLCNNDRVRVWDLFVRLVDGVLLD